jgi:hypothetical protein
MISWYEVADEVVDSHAAGYGDVQILVSYDSTTDRLKNQLRDDYSVLLFTSYMTSMSPLATTITVLAIAILCAVQLALVASPPHPRQVSL